ncbi:MAG: hypothetical protein LBM96_00685 [Methanobrevibacter sp.]|jgi:rRNA maturation endonuclease Nob1|nr:hypothetical protein [Candidatus Methanoflexus mossambicus]
MAKELRFRIPNSKFEKIDNVKEDLRDKYNVKLTRTDIAKIAVNRLLNDVENGEIYYKKELIEIGKL